MEQNLSPELKERAEAILKTESKLKGPRYWQSGVKRSLDLLISGSVAPLALGTCLVGGSAAFLWDRHWPFLDVGNDLVTNNHVAEWKIRTMIPNAKSMELEVAAGRALNEVKDKDKRVTPVGRVLRKLSFDEAPQVFNVFRGDMSAVGPRIPSLADWHNSIYPNRDQEPFKTYIEAAKKGLRFGATGFYVVMGRDKLKPEDRVWLDVMYTEQASLISDLRIMALTLMTPLKLTGK